MKELKTMEETLIRGTYYLGDPSYVIDEDLYYDVLGDKYNFESGKYDLKNEDTYLVIHNTHNGDGTFLDTKQRKYKIESGMIGLVPKKMINEEKLEIAKKNGKIFNFPNKVKFFYDAGIFYIKSGHFIIQINTINEDEYESEHEDHYLKDGEKVRIREDNDDSSIEDMFAGESSDEEEMIKIEKPSFFKK